MEIIRNDQYSVLPGGDTERTYRWLHHVMTGRTAVARVYAEELRDRASGFGDTARALEDQKALTPEEHMQILRACGYVPVRGGATQQTYKWFHNVTSGSSRIAQIYLREIEEALGKRFPRAKVFEEKRELTQADHMKILRSMGFRVPARGATERTSDWLAKAIAGEAKNLKPGYAAEIAARTAASADTPGDGSTPEAGEGETADAEYGNAVEPATAEWSDGTEYGDGAEVFVLDAERFEV